MSRSFTKASKQHHKEERLHAGGLWGLLTYWTEQTFCNGVVAFIAEPTGAGQEIKYHSLLRFPNVRAPVYFGVLIHEKTEA